MVTEKEFLKVLNNKDKGPKPYDTTAEVVRVEDGVAWVHIDGGVEETPAELTINAVKGDHVKVRLVGGQAFLIGNGTAPPTDDRVANDALGVATGARVTAEAAEEVAQVTEQKTRPAITSMITYYKLSNGTPAQPTEDSHEGWSETEPEWSPESDEQLYYSVRSRTVQGVISWSYPHVLSSYANLAILQNAILLEVGEGSTLAYIDDEYGNHLTDENDEPIYANAGSINDAYAQIRVMANEILMEVSETYVNTGESDIHSLSSVMKQTAEGVNIYATINGIESETHSHIDNDGFDIIKDDCVVASFGESSTIGKIDHEGDGAKWMTVSSDGITGVVNVLVAGSWSEQSYFRIKPDEARMGGCLMDSGKFWSGNGPDQYVFSLDKESLRVDNEIQIGSTTLNESQLQRLLQLI